MAARIARVEKPLAASGGVAGIGVAHGRMLHRTRAAGTEPA